MRKTKGRNEAHVVRTKCMWSERNPARSTTKLVYTTTFPSSHWLIIDCDSSSSFAQSLIEVDMLLATGVRFGLASSDPGFGAMSGRTNDSEYKASLKKSKCWSPGRSPNHSNNLRYLDLGQISRTADNKFMMGKTELVKFAVRVSERSCVSHPPADPEPRTCNAMSIASGTALPVRTHKSRTCLLGDSCSLDLYVPLLLVKSSWRELKNLVNTIWRAGIL